MEEAMRTIYIWTMGCRGEWRLTDTTRSIEEAEAVISAALRCGEQLMVLQDGPEGERQWAPPHPPAA